MLDITILAVGKIKEDYFRAAFLEYVKRVRPFLRLKVVELEPASFSHNTQDRAKEIEAERIREYLEKNKKDKPDQNVYLLAERGHVFDSPEMANWLENNQPLILVIGGALGFTPAMYAAYPQLSLSPLTFPHELARVVLMEQLYRAATILNKKNYHY